VLTEIFGSKKDEVSEHFRISLDEELELCRSHNVVRTAKCKRLRWVGHVARMIVNTVK
jgi:hypothetical protein